jgi:hypothetical protein
MIEESLKTKPFNSNAADLVAPDYRRQSPGIRWLAGCLGSLGLFLAFVGALAYTSIHAVLPSASSPTMIAAAKEAQSKKMASDVLYAINKYRTDYGQYPSSLMDLIPTFLPTQAALHLPVDTNPDPSHVSLEYSQPAPYAARDMPVIWYHEETSSLVSPTDLTITLDIDGHFSVTSTPRHSINPSAPILAPLLLKKK